MLSDASLKEKFDSLACQTNPFSFFHFQFFSEAETALSGTETAVAGPETTASMPGTTVWAPKQPGSETVVGLLGRNWGLTQHEVPQVGISQKGQYHTGSTTSLPETTQKPHLESLALSMRQASMATSSVAPGTLYCTCSFSQKFASAKCEGRPSYLYDLENSDFFVHCCTGMKF